MRIMYFRFKGCPNLWGGMLYIVIKHMCVAWNTTQSAQNFRRVWVNTLSNTSFRPKEKKSFEMLRFPGS